MRSPWIISAIVAIGLAPPTFAQQVDPNTRQQVERLTATVGELRKALDESTRAASKNADSLASEQDRAKAAMHYRRHRDED